LENKLRAIFTHSRAQVAHTEAQNSHGHAQEAHEAAPVAQNFALSSCFQSFFRLETPRNLKWLFFTLYCLQEPSRNHWLQSSYPWSFTWYLDLSIYMISHYKTLKTPLE